jgi:phosphopantetheinyl transferase
VPLLFSETFTEAGLLGVWETTETTDDLLAGLAPLPTEQSEALALPHPQKRREFAASRLLLHHLTHLAGLPYHGLAKDDFGKPALHRLDWHLSITHDVRYAAAVLHPIRPVGIDLEAPRETLRRVAPRILSPAELAHADDDLHHLTVYWTAKEALYKLHGKRGLFFSTQLRIEPFHRGDEVIAGEIRAEGIALRCRIRIREFAGEVLAIAI